MTDQPIHPPNTGVTEEAAEALGIAAGPLPNLNGGNPDDGLEDAEPNEIPEPHFIYPGDITESGDDIEDAEIVGQEDAGKSRVKETGRLRRPTEEGSSRTPREPKSGPPSLDEWQDLFSRVLLRVVTDLYISYALRGVDEDQLTDSEAKRLVLTEQERGEIARPFAELSNKSKFMRKHGRMIVASADSFNALIVLGAWMSRVNRIAAKHRPKARRTGGNTRQSTPGRNGNDPTEGATGGRVGPGIRIVNPGT